jgi:hypothetical protein
MATSTSETSVADENKLLLTPKLARAAVREALEIDEPVLLWGPPGVFKSAMMAQLAAEYGVSLVDLRLSMLEPVDLTGIPYVVAGECRTAVPALLPPMDGPEDQLFAESGDIPPIRGILFLDELNQANPAVQGAALQLVLDRRLNNYRLPYGWRVAAAANAREHQAGGYRLGSALTRRFINLDVTTEVQEWKDWAAANAVPPVVLAYVSFRPGNLLEEDLRTRQGPNPRAWFKVGKLVARGLNPDTEMFLLAGLIGQGPATEFVEFVRVWRRLPNPDDVIKNPRTAPVPTDIATRHAICGALASRATVGNVAAIFEYGERLPEEFRALLATDCLRYCRAIGASPVWVAFCAKYSRSFLGC